MSKTIRPILRINENLKGSEALVIAKLKEKPATMSISIQDGNKHRLLFVTPKMDEKGDITIVLELDRHQKLSDTYSSGDFEHTVYEHTIIDDVFTVIRRQFITKLTKEDGHYYLNVEKGDDDGAYTCSFENGQTIYRNLRRKVILKSDRKFSELNSGWNFLDYPTEELKSSQLYKTTQIQEFLKAVNERSFRYRDQQLVVNYLEYRERYPEIDNILKEEVPVALLLVENNANFYEYFKKGKTIKSNIPISKKSLNILQENCCWNSQDFLRVLKAINLMRTKTGKISDEFIEWFVDIVKDTNGYHRTPGYVFIGIQEAVVNHDYTLDEIKEYLTNTWDSQALEVGKAVVYLNKYNDCVKILKLKEYDRFPESMVKSYSLLARDVKNSGKKAPELPWQ